MTGGHLLPAAMHFYVKIAVLNCYISSSLEQISTKRLIFAKFSVENHDVISIKGY